MATKRTALANAARTTFQDEQLVFNLNKKKFFYNFFRLTWCIVNAYKH